MANKTRLRTLDEIDESLISGLETSVRLLHGADTSLLHLTDFGKVSTLDESQVAALMPMLNDLAHGNTISCEQVLSGLDVLRTTRRDVARIERRNRRLNAMLFCALGVIVVETFLVGYYEARFRRAFWQPGVQWVQVCRADGCQLPVPLSDVMRPEEQHPKEQQPSQPVRSAR